MGTLRVALIALVVTASACAPTRTLVLHALPHVNGDRRFFLVVRALKEESQFVSDAYPRIADLVFPSAPDPDVKLVRLMVPGRDERVRIELPGDRPFAIYALFTDPGDSWKVVLTPPLSRRYDVTLEGNRLSVRTQARGQAGMGATAPANQQAAVTLPDLPAGFR
jgi:hypothetical protein